MRQDGLPEPTGVVDLYLAAILDELRSNRPPVAPVPTAGVVELTEPAVRAPAVEPSLFEEPEMPVPPRPVVGRDRARTRKGQPTT